ncbi:hypothetical protein BAE44_0013147 [Dichanthelium oligosanthes]|uniref:TFIIS N-terminal domain-containing protein n=1 Tax=Dichanthelium oligosanthes TaxID=888268 RepID=A0A1E5VL24_9POAL|nr:hypothetical protein BAE44_0013147 [Dichanthelium oligosanthes]
MADHHPLRRWKRFLPSFGAIDAAIEAAGPGISRYEFRRARCGVVERLCDASDDEEDDELCRDLDRAMAESLLTLQIVPVPPAILGRTGLASAVSTLEEHDSERVRSLARDIQYGWRASVEDDLIKIRAALQKLSQIAPDEEDTTPEPDTGEVRRCHQEEQNKIPSQSSKKKPDDSVTAALSKKTTKTVSKTTAALVHGTMRRDPTRQQRFWNRRRERRRHLSLPPRAAFMSSRPRFPSRALPKTTTSRVTGSDRDVSCIDDKIEASKRKLREGYREEEDAKRQRKIQVIKATEMVRQRERRQHPIMRERSRVRYESSVTIRRCFRAP